MLDIRFRRGTLALLSLGMLWGSTGSLAAGTDEEKLLELQNAMKPANVVPSRSRAIVFDKEASAPENSATCSEPPPNTPTTAVDFSIQFKSGSAILDTGSEMTLKQISKILQLSDRCVIVEGHTDAIGNPEKNTALSRQRAESVVRYVIGKGGISPSRLVPVGKGSSEPLQGHDPKDASNRRVVFKVVG